MSSVLNGILPLFISFFISWIIISVALYMAAEVLIEKKKKKTFSNAMAGSFLSLLVLFLFSLFLFPIGIIVGIILAILVLKYIYDVGFIHAFVLAIIALIIWMVLAFILAIVGLSFLALSGSYLPLMGILT
ncbi:MAG: hypothetical protein M1148_02585 [Candidatus Thermoplasmatota archaeon]|nr:hypothetical protein [Candidatus Thermoplasmatota archaeon]